MKLAGSELPECDRCGEQLYGGSHYHCGRCVGTDVTSMMGHHRLGEYRCKSFVLSDDLVLVDIHPRESCAGRPCVIHRPTNHHMTGFPLHWRDDRGIFERICAHGVGHPDPDQFDYWDASGRSSEAVHGCDGCCSPLTSTIGSDSD